MNYLIYIPACSTCGQPIECQWPYLEQRCERCGPVVLRKHEPRIVIDDRWLNDDELISTVAT